MGLESLGISDTCHVSLDDIPSPVEGALEPETMMSKLAVTTVSTIVKKATIADATRRRMRGNVRKGRMHIMSETPPQKVLKAADFAVRLAKAADASPHIPLVNFGRLRWVVDQFKTRFDVSITNETVRKWFAGEAMPRMEMTRYLAQLFEVDEAWLMLGQTPNVTPAARKIRDAQVDGVVNVVAGIIQMQGGHPAFPEDGDEQIDLFAIIKGAQYSFKVALAEQRDGALHFTLPAKTDKVVVIGAVMHEGFRFDFYEIPGDVVEAKGSRRGGYVELTAAASELRPIRSFGQRL